MPTPANAPHSPRHALAYRRLGVLGLAWALTACGGGSGETNPTAPTPPSAGTPTPPPPPPPPAPPPATSPTTAPTVSGQLTPSDTTLSGTFSPQASSDGATPAFATTVYATSGVGTEQWTFGQQVASPDSSGNTPGVAYRLLVVNVTNDRLALQHLEVRYVNGAVRMHSRRCASPCAGATLTRNAAGTGIALDLANTVFRHDAIGTTLSGAPTADLAFTGSLSADWPGAYLFLGQLPQGTSGNLTVDGVAATPRYATTTYNTRPATPSNHPFIMLGLGHVPTTFKVNIPGSAVAQDVLYSPSLGTAYFAAVPNGALVQSPTSHTVSFNQLALPLSGNSGQQVVLNGSFTAGRTSGSLSWTGGSFAPLTDTLVAANRDITYTFTGFTAGSNFQPNLTVKLRGGQVQEALLISGAQDLRCAATATAAVPACQGSVTPSADGRTLTFNGLVLGSFGSPGSTVTVSGQLGSAGI